MYFFVSGFFPLILFVRFVHVLVCSCSLFILIATTHDVTTVQHVNMLQFINLLMTDVSFIQVLNLCGCA